MNKNLAINNAYIDDKPYLYFGSKIFKIGDKRADELSLKLEDEGYNVIFRDRKKTVVLYIFKELKSCGPIPCKTEATDWDNPKFVIKTTGKNKFELAMYK